jgi:thiamine pyrophosphate-dependent acetolactate synthase large subunit-like protein
MSIAEKTDKTVHVRVPSDIARMLAGIIEVQGGVTSEFLDPLIRPAITQRYQEINAALKRIRRAKASVSKAG